MSHMSNHASAEVMSLSPHQNSLAELRANLAALQKHRAELAAREDEAGKAMTDAQKVAARYRTELSQYEDLEDRVSAFRAAQIQQYAADDSKSPSLALPPELEQPLAARNGIAQLLTAAERQHEAASRAFKEAEEAHRKVRLDIEFEVRALMAPLVVQQQQELYASIRELRSRAVNLLGLARTQFWCLNAIGNWQKLELAPTGRARHAAEEALVLASRIVGDGASVTTPLIGQADQKWAAVREALRADANAPLDG